MRRLRGRGPGLHGASTVPEPPIGSGPGAKHHVVDPPLAIEPLDRRADTDAMPEGHDVPQPAESEMLSKTRGSILEFKAPAAAEDPQEANRAFIAALRAGDPRAREQLVER